MMKKTLYICFVFFTFSYCGSKKQTVEKIIQDEVEIVINHLQLSKTDQERKILGFEEIFKIDTESLEIAEKGLTDIRQFAVDSEGNLYLLNSKNPENFYFKFDKKGKFVKAFGKKGQGPGEIQSTIYFRINHLDEIEITDLQKRQLHYFNNEGILVKEMPITFSFQRAMSLRNGNFIIFKDISDFNGEYLIQIPCVLYSPDLIEIKELDKLRLPNYLKGKKKKGYPPYFVLEISNENIFIGNEERGYEILVYDFEGSLKRKIQKEFKKVEIPNEYKEKRLAKIKLPQEKMNTYFPDSFPPFLNFTVDEVGRIFVVTFEQNNKSMNYIDIFNKDGVYIGRTTINGLSGTGAIKIKCRQDHFYYLNEKINGYKELIVFKMIWD